MLRRGIKFIEASAYRSVRLTLRRYSQHSRNTSPSNADSENDNPKKEDIQQIHESQEIKNHPIFFTDFELKSSRLGREALMRFFKSANVDAQTSNRALREIQYLYEEEDSYEKQTRENETLSAVQSANVEKLEMLKKHIEDQEVESGETLKRLNEQLEKEKVYAVSKLARECLDIIDNIQRCMEVYSTQSQNIDASQIGSGEKFLFSSLEDIFKLIIERYKKYEISPMKVSPGDMADPNFHDIVFFVPIPGKPDGEILNVSQNGYTIGERILRPAKIGVIKN